MLTIVGTKLIMQQGDEFSFKIMYCDSSSGDIVNFKSDDVLTMRVRRNKGNPRIVITKVASPFTIKTDKSEENVMIFTFNASDTIELTPGRYTYDLTLMTPSGVRTTLIDCSCFELSESVEYSDEELVILSQVSDTKSIRLCSTPLICRLSSMEILGDDNAQEDSLIIF